jgi:hypothetical protein
MLEVHVQDAEFHRLLGYPRGKQPEGRSAELAAWARAWYADHGRPWIHSREVEILKLEGGAAALLHHAGAHRAFLSAVSAGPQLEEEAQRLWRDGRPDEYFFLEMYGSAVVEHLNTVSGARLCAWADPLGMAVLPHYSPGYPGWDISEQGELLAMLKPPLPDGRGSLDLEVLASGMLRPKKSLLAVFPVVPKSSSTRPLDELVPCTHCSYTPCQYRRVEYRVNRKALRRWAAERVEIARRPDGGIDARFRYDGTTCTNLGRPLRFHYAVQLGPREEGFPIREQCCTPADDGYKHMCRYIETPDAVMHAIASEKPLAGRPLSDVLTWPHPDCAAGCYCDADARAHKWGLVLETIHYKLHNV